MNTKFKKLFAAVLISTSVLSVSQSALANEVSETEISPFVVGVGDTRDAATNMFDGVEYNLFIQNSTEQD